MSLGDFDAGSVLYFKFTTFRPSTGAPFTLAGTPAISVYKDASTTQSTSGVTLTADFDSVTGLNHVAIDTSADGAFYAAGSFFDVVVTTGTVDSVSAVGVVVGRFTLRKTACLKPTTAGRTLDVSAGGEAGIDLANVGSPTTTLNLSGTTIKAVTDRVSANTDQLAGQTVTAAGAVTFPSTVSSLTAAGVRTELATELGRIDVATSTRLASSAYTTPPTAVANATAVRTELTTELGRIDVSVSSRMATFTLPTNFAALGINSSGHISRVTLVDTTTTNTDMRGTDNAALAASWTATRAGYLDSVLIAANANQRTVQVNGNGHVASVLHSSEPDSITVGAFAADSITGAALAASAATEIATATLDDAVEGSETLRQAIRLIRAALVGRLAGAATTTVTMRDAANTKNRITATVTADGNRTDVTTDAT